MISILAQPRWTAIATTSTGLMPGSHHINECAVLAAVVPNKSIWKKINAYVLILENYVQHWVLVGVWIGRVGK